MKVYNRRARFKYQILERLEAGVMLSGAEIKSIRAGRVDLSESFARIRDSEVFLVNAYIKSWMGSQKYFSARGGPAFGGDERRERKLLLHRGQILNWQGKIAGGKFTIVPLSIYIKGNLAKIELALAKSRAKFDKRAILRKRTMERDVERELRGEK